MTLARLITSDLREVVRIHCAAFPTGALTLLGAEAVRRYYEWQLLGREILVRPALLWSPFFRQRCRMALRLLLRFRRVRQSPSPPKKDFEILAIAVDPVSQHSGAGRLLMQECENLARSTGYQQMTLTVACDNLQAIRFYERGGWQKVLNAGAAKWTGKMRKLLR